MSTINKRKSKMIALILHFILLPSIWAVFMYFGNPFLKEAIENDTLFHFIRSGIILSIIWIVPALLLIHLFKSDVHISLKEMFTSKAKWLNYLLVFIILAVAALAVVFSIKGDTKVSSRIIRILFAALANEIVFRGWMLNAIYREDKKWLCFLINAVMAFVITIPSYFIMLNGKFILRVIISVLISRLVSNLVSSFISGWIFIKSKNILIPIVISMALSLLSVFSMNLLKFSVLQ